MLRYGFRTINGRTGGVKVEALARAAAAAPTRKLTRMLIAFRNNSEFRTSPPSYAEARPATRFTEERVLEDNGAQRMYVVFVG